MSTTFTVSEKGLVSCTECGAKEHLMRWTEGDALALVRGTFSWRCEKCCLVAQIAHAEERAAALPALRKRLKEIEECETPNE